MALTGAVHLHHEMEPGHGGHQILANPLDAPFYSPDLLLAEAMDVTVDALGLVVVRPENISVVPGTKNRFGLVILGMFLMTLLWVLGNVRKGSYTAFQISSNQFQIPVRDL